MAPTKETLQATASDTAVSQANSRGKQDSARMRSDAVSLEVPVKVHGSRLGDAASAATAKSEPFQEQASTMIVFPQGGVLKMASPVTAGQMIVVTNLKSGHDSICRVVKVRAYGQGQSYVEIEFTHRQPGYWGVYFPSDGPEVTHQVASMSPAAPPAQPVATESRVEKTGERPTPEVSAPTTARKPMTRPANRPDSVFAPIGSQEQVEPAASATSSPVNANSIAELEVETAMRSPAHDSLPGASCSPAASLSIGELQGDAEAASPVSFAGAGVPGEVAEAPPTDSVSSPEHFAPFGRLAANAVLGGGQAGAREPFGSGLGSSTLGISPRASESSQRKGGHGAAIAVSAVALIAAAAGAAYYFHLPPFGLKFRAKPEVTISAPALPPSAVGTAQTTPLQQPGHAAPAPAVQAHPLTEPAATSAAVESVPSARMNVTAPAPAKPSKSLPTESAAEPTAAGKASAQNPSPKVPDMFGALNAHPTSRTYSADSGQAEAAPPVDAPATEDSDAGLPEIAASSVVAPPPAEPQVPVRIRVGGELKPPRLVTSVLPVYPIVARDNGIEGDVVIDTTIDKTGAVASMKVVSGPPVLREAALRALRQWKYEPSKLNGEPVPVEMTVTIKFHHE
jgi:TonB family protein